VSRENDSTKLAATRPPGLICCWATSAARLRPPVLA